jgi:Arc/MetJ-type ribon-helix-helix transcriptional regulator
MGLWNISSWIAQTFGRNNIILPEPEETAMPRHLTPADLPEDAARYAEAQIAAGRFASVEDMISAGAVALAERDEAEQDWLDHARARFHEGLEAEARGEALEATPRELMARIRTRVEKAV